MTRKRPKQDWLDELNAEFDRRMDAIGVFEVDSYPESSSATLTTFGPQPDPAPVPGQDDGGRPRRDGR